MNHMGGSFCLKNPEMLPHVDSSEYTAGVEMRVFPLLFCLHDFLIFVLYPDFSQRSLYSAF